MAEILQKLYKEYKEAVSQNSELIGRFESAFRLIAYAISIKSDDSAVLSELLLSAQHLFVLFNDAIIKKTSGILPSVSKSKVWLQNLVTILESVGVFVELGAARLFGEPGRWIVITALQIAKCVCRFLLFARHRCGIQPVPPISPIDRNILKTKNKDSPQQSSETSEQVVESNGDETVSSPPKSFTLQRSGKVMRSLSAAVPVDSRDWKVPDTETDKDKVSEETEGLDDSIPSELSQDQEIGECLYIVKPLVHLISLYVCGHSSFKPWILSSSMDVASLILTRSGKPLKKDERAELRLRFYMLLMYLLRSPMYDLYTKERLLSVLHRFSKAVPKLSIVMDPLIEYLPVWQQTYFYTWSV